MLAEINSPKNIGNDGKSKVPGAERITKDLEEARKLAANAVNTEIGRYIEGNEKNLQILDLQAAGLFDQAEILQEINRLDERYGLTVNLEKYREIAIEARNILEDETATAAERAKATKDLEASAAAMEKINGQQARIAENARVTHEATKERAQEIGRITQALNDHLNVVEEIEQSLTGLIGGQVSGKEFSQISRALPRPAGQNDLSQHLWRLLRSNHGPIWSGTITPLAESELPGLADRR